MSSFASQAEGPERLALQTGLQCTELKCCAIDEWLVW
jgi:hypothetical protein